MNRELSIYQIIIYFITFNFFIYCAKKTAHINRISSHEKNTRNSINYNEMENIKKCNLEFDGCIKKCNNEFSGLFRARDTRNIECKNSCVVKFENQDGCKIFYQIRTKGIYKSLIS